MALGATFQMGHAGLITEPLGVNGPIVDQGLTTDRLGMSGPIVGQGIITDTLGFKDGAPAPKLPFDGGDGPDYLQPIGPGPGDALVGSDAADSLVGSDAADSLVGSDAADSFDGGDGPDYVYEMIEMALASAGGLPVTLQDLLVIPGVFDALHAKGPVGDELRGYVDWLIMTGELLRGEGGDRLIGGMGTDRLTFAEAGPAPTGEFTSGQAPIDPVNGWKVEEGEVTTNGYTEVEWTYLTGDDHGHNPTLK